MDAVQFNEIELTREKCNQGSDNTWIFQRACNVDHRGLIVWSEWTSQRGRRIFLMNVLKEHLSKRNIGSIGTLKRMITFVVFSDCRCYGLVSFSVKWRYAVYCGSRTEKRGVSIRTPAAARLWRYMVFSFRGAGYPFYGLKDAGGYLTGRWSHDKIGRSDYRPAVENSYKISR